jgi:hypothetical protein
MMTLMPRIGFVNPRYTRCLSTCPVHLIVVLMDYSSLFPFMIESLPSKGGQWHGIVESVQNDSLLVSGQ